MKWVIVMRVIDLGSDLSSVCSCTASPGVTVLRGTLGCWGNGQRQTTRRALVIDEKLNAQVPQQGREEIGRVKRVRLEAGGEISLVRHESAKTTL